MNQERIGKFIAKKRKDKKLTQSELAEKLNVSDKTVGNWENGRNMPDLSLFKPLCDELGISINELLSGEEIKKADYQEKLEENIVNTIDYSTKKINKYGNTLGLLLVIFGLFISMSAIMIFPSESSWSGFYSVLGIIIFIIGISKLTIKMKYSRRLLLIFTIFIVVVSIMLFMDYINVKNNNQAPIFRGKVTYLDDAMIYDTPIYDVILCEKDTIYEKYNIVENGKINLNNIDEYCLVNKTHRFRKIINDNYEKINGIRILEMTNQVDSEHSYATTFQKGYYEVYKDITDEYSIKTIVQALKRCNYPHYSTVPLYTYLFQLYVNDTVILEFDYGNLYSENESINIIFTEKDQDILKSFIN